MNLNDDNGNETEVVEMTVGSDTPGVWIPAGQNHSLIAADAMSVIMVAKAGKYTPIKTENCI